MGAIAGLIGVGISAFGQYKQGQDAAAVYKYNQALARYEAKYIQDSAKIEEEQLERQVSKYMGRQRALAGKSGTVSDSGSNLTVLEETRREADFDAAIIRYNADVGSWAALNQSNLLATQASQASTAGFINAGGTLLGGASKWDWKRTQSYKAV